MKWSTREFQKLTLTNIYFLLQCLDGHYLSLCYYIIRGEIRVQDKTERKEGRKRRWIWEQWWRLVSQPIRILDTEFICKRFPPAFIRNHNHACNHIWITPKPQVNHTIQCHPLQIYHWIIIIPYYCSGETFIGHDGKKKRRTRVGVDEVVESDFEYEIVSISSLTNTIVVVWNIDSSFGA